MAYELYSEWLQFGARASSPAESETSTVDENIKVLQGVVSKLPRANFTSFKYLILHLKRVTWYAIPGLRLLPLIRKCF